MLSNFEIHIIGHLGCLFQIFRNGFGLEVKLQWHRCPEPGPSWLEPIRSEKIGSPESAVSKEQLLYKLAQKAEL